MFQCFCFLGAISGSPLFALWPVGCCGWPPLVPLQRLFADSRPPAADSLASSDAVVLGQSLPLTGPSAQLGLDYQRAMAWFEEVDRRGGIHGRRFAWSAG